MNVSIGQWKISDTPEVNIVIVFYAVLGCVGLAVFLFHLVKTNKLNDFSNIKPQSRRTRFYEKIETEKINLYQEALDEVLKTLDLDSYRGVVIPQHKKAVVEQIVNSIVSNNQLSQRYLLVMLHQFLHVNIQDRKAYRLFISRWVDIVLDDDCGMNSFNISVPPAWDIYDKIKVKLLD
jgi:hypothetical protein